MDLTTLSAEELDQHRIDVLQEIERRESLALIPRQVETLAERFSAGGGDMQLLVDCVTDPRHTEEAPNG